MGAEANKAESPESMLERVTSSVITLRMWRPTSSINPLDVEGEGQNYMEDVGGGSGFFVSEDGYFLTNRHCVQGSSVFTVEVSNGKVLRAHVVYEDASRDIAVMRVESDARFDPIELGDSDDLKRGQQIWTMGTPHGKKKRVSAGVISGIPKQGEAYRDIADREEGEDGHTTYEAGRDTHIDTDADIHPGNSGGPMLDAQGRVIGINTFIEPTRGGSMGFAMPINEVKVIAKHPEVFALISAALKSIELMKHDEDLRLSESFALCIEAADEAIRGLSPEDKKAVMSDMGVRKMFREALKYARKNRGRYAAAYEEVFGVPLDDPRRKQAQQEVEGEGEDEEAA
jgi:S1-C subfamily serine protease